MLVERGDPDEISDMELAKRVGQALCRQYPDHPWLVSFQGRALVIRHLAIADAVTLELGRQGFGSVLPRDKMGTHKEVEQSAMRCGGEMLEAFGLKRGQWDGTTPTVPKHWKRKQTDFH